MSPSSSPITPDPSPAAPPSRPALRSRAAGGDVTEVALPGIGHRFDLRADEGGDVAVIIHHSGRRDLYVLDGGRAEPPSP